MADTLSMVDITIASARLEAGLRHLAAPAARAARGPTLPVLVPPWEQHSLAAHLAAHRLCAAGRHAVVLPDLAPEAAARMPLVARAPAILVACVDRPARRRLENYLRRLGDDLRGPQRLLFVGGPGFGGTPEPRASLPYGARIVDDPLLASAGGNLYDPPVASSHSG